MRVFVAGFQHETNTFAPSLADWAAFQLGDSFPALVQGEAMCRQLAGTNMPMGGFLDSAARQGWGVIPSIWAGATPSAHVTEDAFERLSALLLDDLRQALGGGVDAVYLDLHGAAVAEHIDDCEGELIARVRKHVGERVPIVASLDLHANVTARMLEQADALVAYRTYPHTDMADTGKRAAELLLRRQAREDREMLAAHRLGFLIPINAQSTFTEPAKTVYEQMAALDTRLGTVTSFCMGFPAADFPECGPHIWSYGERAHEALETMRSLVDVRANWTLQLLSPQDAVKRGIALYESSPNQPVVIADTQDNPGAGADGNTTGMLRALLALQVGRRYPGRVALGMLCDAEAARHAHAAGEGAILTLTLGHAVRTFDGSPSDPSLEVTAKVRRLASGKCRLQGPMMTGVEVDLGPSACLEVDGVLVAVISGKAQLLDRQMLAMVGIHAQEQALIVVKSSNHFRADFAPIASHILVAKASGPMAADPGDLPWRNLDRRFWRAIPSEAT